MNNEGGVFERMTLKGQKQGLEVLDRLYEVAQPSAVFGEPITAGERTVMTASEAWVGLGFGFGIGSGPQAQMGRREQGGEGQQEEAVGGGGGGGGGSGARPVAIIDISPEGVRVEPVVDVSKLGLAALGAMGGMLLMWGKMRRWRHMRHKWHMGVP